MSRSTRLFTAAPLVLAASILPACKTQYAVDVRNNTPQPLYANILERTTEGTFVRAATRLGPGDRGAVGPVMAPPNVCLVQIDTRPNPVAPWSMDLPPGVTTLEVTQTEEGNSGQLQVRDLTP